MKNQQQGVKDSQQNIPLILSKKKDGRWTNQEHQKFLDALCMYGRNWKQIQNHVRSRSRAQLRSHAQKFFSRLEKELKLNLTGLKSNEIRKIFQNLNQSKGNPIIQNLEQNFKQIQPPLIETKNIDMPNYLSLFNQIVRQSEVSENQFQQQYSIQLLEIQRLLQQRTLLEALLNSFNQDQRQGYEQGQNNNPGYLEYGKEGVKN